VFLAVFFAGYWAVYFTTVAEQFGTNLRSTVTSSVLNIVRATPIVMNISFLSLKDCLGVIPSLQIVRLAVFVCTLFSLRFLRETYSDDLDFIEG